MLLEENLVHLFLLKNKKEHISLLRLHFVSRNISLYRDTSEAIYRYIYTLYCCISTVGNKKIYYITIICM